MASFVAEYSKFLTSYRSVVTKVCAIGNRWIIFLAYIQFIRLTKNLCIDYFLELVPGELYPISTFDEGLYRNMAVDGAVFPSIVRLQIHDMYDTNPIEKPIVLLYYNPSDSAVVDEYNTLYVMPKWIDMTPIELELVWNSILIKSGLYLLKN